MYLIGGEYIEYIYIEYISLSDSHETFLSVESHVSIDFFIVRNLLLPLVLVSHEVLSSFWFDNCCLDH